MADFRRALINQHGQIVIDREGFKPTTDFEHHYLKHLWTHIESSAEGAANNTYKKPVPSAPKRWKIHIEKCPEGAKTLNKTFRSWTQ